MTRKLNPEKTYHQISVGPFRKMWADFISYCEYEGVPLCDNISAAMEAYQPFQQWREREEARKNSRALVR